MSPLPKVRLNRTVKHRCMLGHPWIFDTEFEPGTPNVEPGAVVDVEDFKGRWLGRGAWNAHSKIRVRLLTRREEEVIDAGFIRRRIAGAVALRGVILDEPHHGRLVYSEADGLPGLVVDRFGPVVSMQIQAAAMEAWRGVILEALWDLGGVEHLHERSDASYRSREGLAPAGGWIGPTGPDRLEARENGYTFHADLAGGQKTGYFYDQRDNRRALARLVKDATVLDCFCYVGSFGVHAAGYGARSVRMVDFSEEASAMAQENARINGVEERCEVVTGNAFDLLREYEERGESFDVVVLDPPAFAKNRASRDSAARGYNDINRRGMRLVRPGGFLVTCSCSYHFSREDFEGMLVKASVDARRSLRVLESRGQALDHPVLVAAPETSYLKCVIAQVE